MQIKCNNNYFNKVNQVLINKTTNSAKNILFKRIYNLYIINADILLIFTSNIFMAFPFDYTLVLMWVIHKNYNSLIIEYQEISQDSYQGRPEGESIQLCCLR